MMEFIDALPDGFGTYLGENGASLSGGQNQRLAIARALYRDPEILILDEATASLDQVSEVYVQRAIRNFADQAKTVIFITHRLAAVKDFDLLFVLDQGKVVEQGTPKELLDMGGKYSHMINKQLILSH